jgi:hypothetical protein
VYEIMYDRGVVCVRLCMRGEWGPKGMRTSWRGARHVRDLSDYGRSRLVGFPFPREGIYRSLNRNHRFLAIVEARDVGFVIAGLL